MPTKAELRSLIERLEKATGADREIDADLYIQFYIPAERIGRIDRLGGTVGWRPKDAPYEGAVDVPRFTASLDAAIALVEQCLPDHMIEMGRYTDADGFSAGCFARVSTDCGGDGPRFEVFDRGEAKTLPLALILALLRSLEAQETDNA